MFLCRSKEKQKRQAEEESRNNVECYHKWKHWWETASSSWEEGERRSPAVSGGKMPWALDQLQFCSVFDTWASTCLIQGLLWAYPQLQFKLSDCRAWSVCNSKKMGIFSMCSAWVLKPGVHLSHALFRWKQKRTRRKDTKEWGSKPEYNRHVCFCL